jgi:transcriptional regulator with XRE-family HTH domain
MMIMDIGTRLKEVREGKANQQQIADLLKTTQQQISKYENNIQEIPCRHIITLAQFFDVSTDYLLCLTDIKEKYW